MLTSSPETRDSLLASRINITEVGKSTLIGWYPIIPVFAFYSLDPLERPETFSMGAGLRKVISHIDLDEMSGIPCCQPWLQCRIQYNPSCLSCSSGASAAGYRYIHN